MAVLAMTPKLLGRISNEKYQEKDMWKIDDIALGPANELLISGHNLEKPITFISMYKKDSGKYDNRPEFSRNFRQRQPCGEQLVLFLEDNSIIGLKVESALQVVSIKGMVILKTLTWKLSPTCVCFYRGKLYAASSSTNIVSVCNLDSEEKSAIVLSEISEIDDCVLDMVVVMEEIYVCTKVAGRALVFSMTGSKKLEFEYSFESDAKATSICIHERTELVFVLWNNIQIQLYSQKTSRCLRAIDMTEELHKIRVTTENVLVTLSASKCVVSVYDVGEAIKFGERQNTILSSVKKKHQSNVEELRDMKELYMKQLEENENLQRQYDRDVQKVETKLKNVEENTMKLEDEVRQLKERFLAEERISKEVQTPSLKLNENINDLEDMRTELESQQKAFKDSLVQEKRKVSREERSRVQVETKLKKVEERNMKLEDEVRQLKERLLAEEKISKEVQTPTLKIRLPNMTLEKKVHEMEETIQLQERKAEEAMNMLSTIQTDLKEVKSNTSKLLQGNEGIATAAEELKKDLAGLSKTRRILQKESGVSTSSEDSGRSSLQSIVAIEKAVRLYNESDGQKYRLANNFQSSKIITKDGGRVDIKGTDVSLLVPPGALLGDCEIHIQLITGNLETGKDVKFASNSAAIVELTPDNFEFQTAVELQLPHCLQLKENFTNESVEVLTSHHDPKASPHWERETEVKFELQEETCKLYLKKFCWITLRINNEIVEAKRLKIFTVGSKVIDTDSETTVHVGYFHDVPGNEDIFIDKNITVGQYKPFWFKKEEPTPLVIFLQFLTPNEWENTADESRKEISYQDIASSKNRSCEFVLRCISSVRRSGVPYATFRVYRQHDSTSISFRPKKWDDVSEDEEP